MYKPVKETLLVNESFNHVLGVAMHGTKQYALRLDVHGFFWMRGLQYYVNPSSWGSTHGKKPNWLADANEQGFIKFAHLSRRKFSDGNAAKSLLQIVFGDCVNQLEQEFLLQEIQTKRRECSTTIIHYLDIVSCRIAYRGQHSRRS